MTMNATQYSAEVSQLVTRSRAALRIWIAAVQVEHDSIDTEEAAALQTALGVVIEALNEACDDDTAACAASTLPLYRVRDLLGLVDRVLWSFQGGDAVAPERVDLLGTAELAAATLAKFESTACVNMTRASNVVSLALVRTEEPRPTH